MGLFSWNTQDTKRSICCTGSGRDTFGVTMTDDKGNKWYESEYEGYGIFGGKDFYELLAEMNGFGGRDKGIDLFFGDAAFISPNLTESRCEHWKNKTPEDCEFQGYFYDED